MTKQQQEFKKRQKNNPVTVNTGLIHAALHAGN